MYFISKEFHFAASHQLNEFPDGHQCKRLHGHNYVVKVILAGAYLDNKGVVLDYGELSDIKGWIDATLDHRHLNDIIHSPTAENLARYLFDAFSYHRELFAVEVKESDKTSAMYTPYHFVVER